MGFEDWFNIFGQKKKDKKGGKDGKDSRQNQTRINFDAGSTASDRVNIDTNNLNSNDQVRDNKYTSTPNRYQVRPFFDDLSNVRRKLEEKNFILLEKIGTGNYAEVYHGRDIQSADDVAIKVIALTETNRRYQENNLPQEIQVIRTVKHRRIIKMYTVFEAENKIVMVMEFASRGTMGDLISEKGALREAAAWALFREVHRGVAYMHRNMAAHRDLKLENILVWRYLKV